MKRLTYSDGYLAGFNDRQRGESLAWSYDHGDLQSAEWKRGYADGQSDYPAFCKPLSSLSLN